MIKGNRLPMRLPAVENRNLLPFLLPALTELIWHRERLYQVPHHFTSFIFIERGVRGIHDQQ